MHDPQPPQAPLDRTVLRSHTQSLAFPGDSDHGVQLCGLGNLALLLHSPGLVTGDGQFRSNNIRLESGRAGGGGRLQPPSGNSCGRKGDSNAGLGCQHRVADSHWRGHWVCACAQALAFAHNHPTKRSKMTQNGQQTGLSSDFFFVQLNWDLRVGEAQCKIADTHTHTHTHTHRRHFYSQPPANSQRKRHRQTVDRQPAVVA